MGARPVRGFVEALSLLTRIPARSTGNLQRALPWFPIVGGVIGLAVAVAYALSVSVVPAPVAAMLATGAGIVVTGALHEDGLADTADAFGVRGVGRERTVEIMKDPRVGTYGAVALIVSIGLRASALASLSRGAAFVALPAAHAIGRSSSLAATTFAPMSSSSTLGAAYARSMGRLPSVLAAASALGIAVGTLGAWSIGALALGIVTAVSIARAATRRIGGLTGDVLGAVEQITEAGVLVLAVAIRGQIPW